MLQPLLVSSPLQAPALSQLSRLPALGSVTAGMTCLSVPVSSRGDRASLVSASAATRAATAATAIAVAAGMVHHGHSPFGCTVSIDVVPQTGGRLLPADNIASISSPFSITAPQSVVA